MKKNILLPAVLLIAFGWGCAEKQTAKTMLANPGLRTEIFTEIAGNENYMTEFTAQMAENKACQQVCVRDMRIVKAAWESERMDSILNSEPLMVQLLARRMIRQMEKDTMICRTVCDAAVKNSKLKKQ